MNPSKEEVNALLRSMERKSRDERLWQRIMEMESERQELLERQDHLLAANERHADLWTSALMREHKWRCAAYAGWIAALLCAIAWISK